MVLPLGPEAGGFGWLDESVSVLSVTGLNEGRTRAVLYTSPKIQKTVSDVKSFFSPGRAFCLKKNRIGLEMKIIWQVHTG